jgi:hypothetical protein
MGRPNTKGFQGGVSISVAGGTLSGIAYILDGAMHNDVQNDGGLPLPFPVPCRSFAWPPADCRRKTACTPAPPSTR